MYVSSYDEVFMQAFNKGVDTMPDKTKEIVKTLSDKIHDLVLDSLFYYIETDMKGNLDGAIRQEASKVCESMLRNALAGDSKELRNLFDFNDWYMKSLYAGQRPTQWALINALIAANPEVFVSEKIAQLTADVQQYQRENARLQEYIQNMRVKYEGYAA